MQECPHVFFPEHLKKVIQGLYKSLVNGGWLIVSPAEASHNLFSQFSMVDLEGIHFYKKEAVKDYERETLTQPLFVPSETAALFGQKAAEQKPETVVLKTVPVELKPSLYYEARVLFEQGFYSGAIEKLETLLSEIGAEDKVNPEAMSLLSRAYANQGRLDEALKWCESAIASEKLNQGNYYLRAMILQELGRTEEAITSLKKALYLDPEFVLAYFALGILSIRQGRVKESEMYFRNTISLLKDRDERDIIPDSEGMTAGRVRKVIESIRIEKRL